MGPALVALALLGLALADTAAAGDGAVAVVQESRLRDAGKKTVRHTAVLRNASGRAVQGLRVTVELYDYFGKLLWARTVAPAPASLAPGERTTVSLTTPHLDDHRQTRYRFAYRQR